MIMEYKYDLHCHTGLVSRCADADIKDTVRAYDEAGFSGIVLTDHYSLTTFRHTPLTPQQHTDFYLSAYDKMKKFAGNSFTVLLGLELRYYYTINDYLIYGVDRDWLTKQGNLLALNPKKMYEIAKKEGYLVCQAHPYRKYMTRCNPDYLDGIEVYNGKTEKELNDKAKSWAESTGKIQVAGSDFHHIGGQARGGIITNAPITDNKGLTECLRSGDYKLITT